MAKKEVKKEKELSRLNLQSSSVGINPQEETEKRAEKERIKALSEYYTAHAIRMQIQKLCDDAEQKNTYLRCLRKALKVRIVIEQKDKK